MISVIQARFLLSAFIRMTFQVARRTSAAAVAGTRIIRSMAAARISRLKPPATRLAFNVSLPADHECFLLPPSGGDRAGGHLQSAALLPLGRARPSGRPPPAAAGAHWPHFASKKPRCPGMAR